MNKDISPEERLFNAIQEGKKIPVRRKAELKSNHAGKSFWQNLLSSLKLDVLTATPPLEIPTEKSDQKQSDNIKLINRILFIVLALLIIAVCYKIVYERPILSEVNIAPPEHKVSFSQEVQVVEEFKPLETYLDEVKKRDIFHPPAPPEPEPVKEEVKPVEVGPDIKEVMKNLSLAGIYEGQSLEAMIEDKELKKTYFVKQGDEIKGLKIKSILKDRVVLQLGSQEADLL